MNLESDIPEQTVKAVVFDFGNVLSLPQSPGTMAKLASLAGIDEATMTRILWAQRGNYDRGIVSGVDYYRAMLASVGKTVPQATLERIVDADLDSWARLNPDSLTLAGDARALRLKIGILSNMPHEFLRLSRERFPLFKQVDAGIYSCELGCNKPEPVIYKALLAALDMDAGSVVFFDDIQENVDGARALGIQAFLWTSPDQARRDLRKLGVAV